MQATAISIEHSNSGQEYDNWLFSIHRRFNALDGGPIFTTDVEGLWEAYLDGFDPSQRQFHNCSACRHFIQRIGGLVTISETGATGSVIWDADEAPLAYRASVAAMVKLIKRAKVTGVFVSADHELGTGITGPWTHFSVFQKTAAIHKSKVLTAGQAMAEKSEDHKNVMRALQEFSPALIAQALSLLNSDAMYRAEKVIGPAQWLSELHTACEKSNRSNAVWRAIATAPAGFCHPRASMIGTLLEDLESGMSFEAVSTRFASKMHPLQYQRPQAAPSAGTIAQAEKLVEQLGIAKSLERRFARLEDLKAEWLPDPEVAPAGGGVFAHLKPKEATRQELIVTAQTITWEKFARTVLPIAKLTEINAPGYGAYTALVTAEHPDAPPIFQWDSEQQRNPVSLYLYNGGSPPSRWNIQSGWRKVTAITLRPSMWYGLNEHHGKNAIFIIEGCRDLENRDVGLFPETLKSELHGVRAVIEAHSRTAKLGGAEQATACGLMCPVNGTPTHVRVTDAVGTRFEYKIDRWD
jgi:hypothetical protein